MKVPNTKANKPLYYLLDASQSLKEALFGKQIIEFPTILVVSSTNKRDYTIITTRQEINNFSLLENNTHVNMSPTPVLAASLLSNFLNT